VANAATLTDLQNRALDYADMTSSAFPVTARLTDYINDGLAELHDLLAPYDYIRSTSSITLAAGTEEYALPTDFYRATAVWLISNDRRYMLDRFTMAQLDGFKTTGPTSAGSAQLWYVPQLTKLSAGADVVHVALPIGWESFAALHAAIQLLNREESDPQPLMAERERIKQRILANIEPRDLGVPAEVEDHYARWSGAVCEPIRSLRYRILGNKIHFVEVEEG
jgi:hypothetical protein